MPTNYLTTDTDLTSVANAIRAKSGGSSQLAFPAGFVSEIGSIPSGQTMYYTSRNIPYVPNLYLPAIQQGNSWGMFDGASELMSVVCDDTRTIGGANGTRINNYFNNCAKLNSVSFPYLAGIASGYTGKFLGNCRNLKTAIFGSVGYPMTSFKPTSSNDLVFDVDTQNDLVITVYVNASTLDSVPAEVTTYAPWGATNATIVYRSSTTGEVLT